MVTSTSKRYSIILMRHLCKRIPGCILYFSPVVVYPHNDESVHRRCDRYGGNLYIQHDIQQFQRI